MSNAEQNNSSPEITAKSVLPLADKILNEWRPYLNTEGEMLLGREGSISQALILQLTEALFLKEKQTEESCKILATEIGLLKKENEQLKSGYTELCKRYDDIKKLIHRISVKQGKYRVVCDKNFEEIENGFRRLEG